MGTKSVIPCALILALLGTRQVPAQDFLRARESPDVPSATQMPLLPELPPPIALPTVTGPDNYITYNQPCCNNPVGGDGPISWEVFVRTGPRLQVGGSFLNHFMTDGWMVQGGGRSLFYNVQRDAAWTAEIGLSQSFNQGRNNMWLSLAPKRIVPVTGGPQFTPFYVPGDVVTVNWYQQTLANFGLGREWYLLGSAQTPGTKWRIGADGGGLWGAANISYHDFTPTFGGPNINFGQSDRRSHVAGGYYASLHTDIEYPCNCCTFVAGFRAEWSFTTTRVLVNADNGIYWVNLLLNFGVKF